MTDITLLDLLIFSILLFAFMREEFLCWVHRHDIDRLATFACACVLAGAWLLLIWNAGVAACSGAFAQAVR